MHLLPPAPVLPDLAEVLRKATKEGIKQGIALAKKDEGKYSFMRCVGFFGLIPFICSEEEARAKIKREREHSPEGLFVAQDDKTETSIRGPLTILSSGPYAGLHSAKKRVRENDDPDQESRGSFGRAKKIAKEAAVHENVDSREGSKSSFGPAKKVAKTGGVLTNV